MVIEITFPRGGRKPPPKVAQAPIIKRDFDLFGDDRKKAKQKHKERQAPKEKEKPVSNAGVAADSADLLTYRSVQEGMVTFGCIREVQKMTLGLQLPGRLTGRVMITHISTPYTKLLHSIVDDAEPEGYKTLRQLFYPGQCVATKVIKIDGADEKFRLGLSLLPDDINAQLLHTSLTTGMTLWGAISSCEEHGYVVDLGIQNCRAFLQKTNVDQGKEYVVGELLWAVVQKCDSTQTATIVSLNAISKKVDSTRIIKEISLDNCRPGMQVEFTVKKILENGLEGTFLNNFTGYIHEGQLPKVMERLQKYAIDQIIVARVMYVMPITKLAYLTMRSLEPHDRSKINDGAIVNSKILSSTRGGLYLQLNKHDKGFVSYRRLKNGTPFSTEDDEVIATVKKTYPKGSSHQCRVLNFDFLDRVFICSLEKELLKPIVFSLKDLKNGEEVTGTIKTIQSNGLVVQVGKVYGFIQNEHLSDVVMQSQANFKNKFSVGQIIKSKVWVVKAEKNLLYLTIKPMLMSTEDNLTSYEEAVVKKQFPGVIVQITTNGLLLQFFGDVHGWVPKSLMSFENIHQPTEMFKIGQVVKSTVIKYDVNSQKLTMSLLPPRIKDKSKTKLMLGQHVSATVSNVSPTGVEVIIDETNATAIIPLLHLTKFISLAPLIADTLKKDDKIPDLVCVCNYGQAILSLRELELNETKIPAFDNLKSGQLLSCSVHIVTDKYMLLQSPIVGYPTYIKIPSGNILSHGSIQNIDIKQHQPMTAKLYQIKSKPFKKIGATTQLFECWNYNVNSSVKLLSEYLSTIAQIKGNFSTLGNPLANLELGEIVKGTVQEELDCGTYTVQLNNGALGYVNAEHCSKALKIGEKVSGVVLWLNFEHEYAEISLIPKYKNTIHRQQNGQININTKNSKSNLDAEVLLVKEDFALLVLHGTSGNKQLVFLPIRLHINDLAPNPCYYMDSIGKLIKIDIKSIENGRILGVPKEPIKKIILHVQKNTKLTRISDTSLTEFEPSCKKPRMDPGSSDVDSHKERKNKKKNKLKDVSNNEATEAETISKNKNNQHLSVVNNEETQTKRKLVKIDKIAITEESTVKNKKKDKKREAEQDIENIKAKVQKLEDKKQDQEILNFGYVIDTKPILPGASDFWKVPKHDMVQEESSGDEDEEEKARKQLKKKKLTPAERADAARVEEERIQKIETELADLDTAPKTADQFDRLVMANPNNSEYWINYMAFHLEATEIEKAKTVARKALATIEFREEQEKLNVWIAFLNLENRYGTKESFTTLLEEATQMNDSFTVYLQALNILSDSKKITEFSELLQRVSRKFKQVYKMWTKAAEACYKCDLKDQARNLMQRALQSLDEKHHVNLLVQFAFMESRFNDPERAEALLEKVLASYPRRVDVWTSYVDMLIKGNRIHIARNVLVRAVGQKLPAQKMKTIFIKYVQFETKYGDEDSVAKVRKLAAEYVKTALQ